MSSSKKKGLGRGLSALFGDQKIEPKKNESINIQNKALIGDLKRNRYQPRTFFDETKLAFSLLKFQIGSLSMSAFVSRGEAWGSG